MANEMKQTDPNQDAYTMGLHRGQTTGRAEPTDRDWQWLCEMHERATDPQVGVDFAIGMAEGAAEEQA